MQNRLTMNSQSLQKNFSETYQEFFSKCQIVCSAPRSFTWIGEQAVRYGGIMIRQALPLRTYVGIAPRRDKKITIEKYLDFYPQKNSFTLGLPQHLDQRQKEKIEKSLLPFLKEICQIENPQGASLFILNELPLERGVGSVGALFVSLISSFLLWHKKITPQEINEWKNKKTSDLITDKSLRFDFLFRTLWKWETLNYLEASGANVFPALIPSAFPIIFLSKKQIPSHLSPDDTISLKDLDFVDNSFYSGAKMNELVKKTTGWPWPFDFGLIHTGEVFDITNSILSLKNLRINIIQNIKQTIKSLGPLKKHFNDTTVPYFYQLAQEKDENLWREYMGSLNMNGLQTCKTIEEILENGISSEKLKDFCDLINRESHFFYLLNFSNPKIESFSTSLKNILEKNIQREITLGTKVSGTTRGGEIIFVASSQQIRNKMEEAISGLKEINKDAHLDYASWLDGYEEEEGLKVEQFWQEGIYSKFVPEEALVLKEYKVGEKTQRIITYEKLKKENYTLLLDTLENKIYIKGKALTSKDLPSQAATIQILSALLESESHSLSNRNLPAFSYTKYRNEMQGKIVTPLSRLTDGKVKMILDGGLMDFIVRLETAKSVKIGILEKIGR